jgi:hypothetical protein
MMRTWNLPVVNRMLLCAPPGGMSISLSPLPPFCQTGACICLLRDKCQSMRRQTNKVCFHFLVGQAISSKHSCSDVPWMLDLHGRAWSVCPGSVALL